MTSGPQDHPLPQAPGRTGRRLRLHLAGILAVPVCIAAGAFELTRALAGNQLSWAYTVEWPVIAVYVVYMWRRLAREIRLGPAGDDLGRRDRQPVVPTQPEAQPEAPADPGLQAWRQYLSQLHATDPPGGPPPR